MIQVNSFHFFHSFTGKLVDIEAIALDLTGLGKHIGQGHTIKTLVTLSVPFPDQSGHTLVGLITEI